MAHVHSIHPGLLRARTGPKKNNVLLPLPGGRAGSKLRQPEGRGRATCPTTRAQWCTSRQPLALLHAPGKCPTCQLTPLTNKWASNRVCSSQATQLSSWPKQLLSEGVAPRRLGTHTPLPCSLTLQAAQAKVSPSSGTHQNPGARSFVRASPLS